MHEFVERLKAAATRGVRLNRRLGRADNIRFFEGYIKALDDLERLALAASDKGDGRMESGSAGLPVERQTLP